jgi:hypothetical protein
MKTALSKVLMMAVSAFVFTLASIAPAQAGLVTGRWDPQFGTALPNLSWQARTEWLVPNSCSSAADGVYSTSASGGPCEDTGANLRVLAIFVRWFDTVGGDPNNFFESDAYGAYTGWCESTYLTNADCSLSNIYPFTSPAFEPLIATNVRVALGQVVGFDTNITSFLTGGTPASAGKHTFGLSFTTNFPVFTCSNTIGGPPGYDTPPTDHSCDGLVTADNTNLNQYLITYNSSDTSDPKFKDSNGNALGVRLNGQGQVIPEPGALMLVLLALGAAGASRRRVA